MEATKLQKTLIEIASGDLSGFSDEFETALKRAQLEKIKLQKLCLTRASIINVLSVLQEGAVQPHLAQKWASFMKRGYIGTSSCVPLDPIEIDYDKTSEEIIVEVLSRLDEIGDLIDGNVEPREIGEWIRLLTD